MGLPKITRPRRHPSEIQDVLYFAECLECSWKDPEAMRGTQSAREHAIRYDHKVQCAIERVLYYNGVRA